MNRKFNKLNEQTKHRTLATVCRRSFKQAGRVLAGLALAGFGMANLASAQTSEVCDFTGDPAFSSGKGGPKVPDWLDIVHSEITDAGSDIHFTLTLADAIPVAPAWKLLDDGGQMWWGWRFVNDLATTPVIKDGCVKAAGQDIPAGYFVDLIWDVTSASFHARLLDDTTCVQNEVPFVFSDDRKSVTLVGSKSLLTNPALIPDPDTFEYFAATTVWKANATGNNSFFSLETAPDEGAAPWSAFENVTHSCE